jgi:hypothetical protein
MHLVSPAKIIHPHFKTEEGKAIYHSYLKKEDLTTMKP